MHGSWYRTILFVGRLADNGVSIRLVPCCLADKMAESNQVGFLLCNVPDCFRVQVVHLVVVAEWSQLNQPCTL